MPPTPKAVSWTPQANMPVIKVNSVTTNRKCMNLNDRTPYPEEDSTFDSKTHSDKNRTQAASM
jgi:hypothetical protein